LEAAGKSNNLANGLTQEISIVTKDIRKITFHFERLSWLFTGGMWIENDTTTNNNNLWRKQSTDSTTLNLS